MDSAELETDKKGMPLWKFLALLAAFAWVLRSFIVAPFMIPSGSMMPTMLVGDYLFVSKWPYGYSKWSFPLQIPSFEGRILESMPERGDIVVFQSPDASKEIVVKRVIGLPGDEIEMRSGHVVLNGTPLPKERMRDFGLQISQNSPCNVAAGARPFIEPDGEGGEICRYPAYRETLPSGRSYTVLDQVDGYADALGPFTVPEGHLFMLGDNRDASGDSRFSISDGGVGYLPMENVIGRAEMNFWSTDGSASYFLPWTWFTALRGSRVGVTY